MPALATKHSLKPLAQPSIIHNAYFQLGTTRSCMRERHPVIQVNAANLSCCGIQIVGFDNPYCCTLWSARRPNVSCSNLPQYAVLEARRRWYHSYHPVAYDCTILLQHSLCLVLVLHNSAGGFYKQCIHIEKQVVVVRLLMFKGCSCVSASAAAFVLPVTTCPADRYTPWLALAKLQRECSMLYTVAYRKLQMHPVACAIVALPKDVAILCQFPHHLCNIAV